MSKLTKEEVLHIATLAKLSLTDEEVDTYTSQLGETAHYVENLSELDTDSVSPTNNASKTENIFFDDGTPCTRMLSQEDAVLNSKQKKDDKYFVVKRIM
jgi:aspartyl-tRNA(Asn)/glutamyl-tRNA(Gln) amidotransferase subunit C